MNIVERNDDDLSGEGVDLGDDMAFFHESESALAHVSEHMMVRKDI